MVNRFDAWTEAQDKLLAETVLRHVREGSTQQVAFSEAGEAINRTGAACGYRWNKFVRHKYMDELAQAKRDRRKSYPRGTDLGINSALVKDLMLYAGQKGRTATDVAEEAIRHYLQGVAVK